MNDELYAEIWRLQNDTYKSIAEALRATFSGLKFMSGHNRNEAFLFRSYGEYWIVDDNSVVISLNIQRVENGIHIFGDIYSESGYILLDLMDDVVSGDDELLEKARAFASRCETEEPLISAELRDQLAASQAA